MRPFRFTLLMRRRLLPAVAAVLLLSDGGLAASGDLEALRLRALELVNAEREERGLAALSLGENLGEAAQTHAEDMVRRDYYAHRSPEGEDVADRYVEAGGSASNLVAENIALCGDCATPPDAGAVERLHRLWMESPGHRANILARGLERFGFGARADERGRLYGVQTFAGPGVPRGVGEGEEEAAPLPEAEQAAAAVRLLNEARRERGLPPVEASGPLTSAAGALLPEEPGADPDLGQGGAIGEAVPEEHRGDWRRIAALAGSCTGCGARPSVADLRFFLDQWLASASYSEALLDPAVSALGFALEADGEGGKTGIAVAGAPR